MNTKNFEVTKELIEKLNNGEEINSYESGTGSYVTEVVIFIDGCFYKFELTEFAIEEIDTKSFQYYWDRSPCDKTQVKLGEYFPAVKVEKKPVMTWVEIE